jgi:hypothetical protein
MARIWISDHDSGIGQSSQRVTSVKAWSQTKAAWDAFKERGYQTIDATAGHIVLRCPRHTDGACAQINVQR